MKKIIDDRIEEIKAEKAISMDDFKTCNDSELQSMLSAIIMRINIELYTLNKLSEACISLQTEQLKDFLHWRDKQNILTLHDYDNDELIRLYHTQAGRAK